MRLLPVLYFAQNDVPCFAGLAHVNDPLVSAPPEQKCQIALLQFESAVNQYIGLFQQGIDGGVVFRLKLLQCVAGVSSNIQMLLMQPFCKLCKRCGLAERFAAAEGNTFEQRVFHNFFKQCGKLRVFSAVEIMCLRIVAAGAVVGASLGENHIADALAVHDGFIYRAAYSKCIVHGSFLNRLF